MPPSQSNRGHPPSCAAGAAVLDGNVANATNDGNRFFGDYAINVTIGGISAMALIPGISGISANALKSRVGGIGGNAPNATVEVRKLPGFFKQLKQSGCTDLEGTLSAG